jgi:hypothetical protein
MDMSSSKPVDDFEDEEIYDDYNLYTTVEFTIDNCKFIFKNIDIRIFGDYDRMKIIKLLVRKIKWYMIGLYDKVYLFDNWYMLTEKTKSKYALTYISKKEFIVGKNNNDDIE